MSNFHHRRCKPCLGSGESRKKPLTTHYFGNAISESSWGTTARPSEIGDTYMHHYACVKLSARSSHTHGVRLSDKPTTHSTGSPKSPILKGGAISREMKFGEPKNQPKRRTGGCGCLPIKKERYGRNSRQPISILFRETIRPVPRTSSVLILSSSDQYRRSFEKSPFVSYRDLCLNDVTESHQ